MNKIIKGNPIGPFTAPDHPYGPGGPKIEGGEIKLPPLSAPDLPYGPGGPKIGEGRSDKSKGERNV